MKNIPEKLEGKYFSLQDWTAHLLGEIGLKKYLQDILAVLINGAALFLVCWMAYLILRKVILLIVTPWLKKTKDQKGTIFIEKKAFDASAHLASGMLLYYLLPIFFNINHEVTHILRVLTILYIIVMFMIALTRFFHSLEYLGRHSKKYEKKPISSYIQVVLILSYLFCGVLIVSFLFNKSPMTIITAFGAGMAIVLLVFKDLILGLIASIQVSVNDMVRVGDWISVHNYNADGEVSEINLTSVKVRNWDYTVANVPTYALVSNGFQNVREMQDMGFRRMMHHLLLDIRSIKAVDKDFMENLRKDGLFTGKVEELSWKDNKKDDYDYDQVNTITNLSLFRRYIESFLENHPGIDNVYLVVRQLQTDGNGLPIEVYGFVKSVSFKPLNYVQSDVFEHLYSVIDKFELEPYQRPLGKDFKDVKQINPSSEK